MIGRDNYFHYNGMQPINKKRPFITNMDEDIYGELNGLFVGHKLAAANNVTVRTPSHSTCHGTVFVSQTVSRGKI